MRVIEEQNAQLLNRLEVDRQIVAIKERYADFDGKAIQGALLEMTEEERRSYDNPLGWENIYLRQKAQQQGETEEGAGQQAPLGPRGQMEPPFSQGNLRSTAQVTGATGQVELPDNIRASGDRATLEAAGAVLPVVQLGEKSKRRGS